MVTNLLTVTGPVLQENPSVRRGQTHLSTPLALSVYTRRTGLCLLYRAFEILKQLGLVSYSFFV